MVKKNSSGTCVEGWSFTCLTRPCNHTGNKKTVEGYICLEDTLHSHKTFLLPKFKVHLQSPLKPGLSLYSLMTEMASV